jgi:beta-N-acetylhexosaminidase
MACKAFISGCAGLSLGSDEIGFFRGEQPWGFILFKRNVDSPSQLRDLTAALRDAVGRPDAPVLVDQEGGRVQRLRDPHWPDYPAGRVYGEVYARDRQKGLTAAWLGMRLIAADLQAVGIDVDCVPCLDVPVEGAHDVIGRRAYSLDPGVVATIGRAAAEGLKAGGVLPIMKHIPGHGRAGVDSHLSLPHVDTDLETLEEIDFAPFRAMADMPMAMTAHVVYDRLDPDHPATISREIISRVIRGSIGFNGLLMTDDLGMKALAGTTAEKTRAALAAGVDLVLHCNGVMDEMRDVADNCPELAGLSAERAAKALSHRRQPEPLDEAAARAELAALIA